MKARLATAMLALAVLAAEAARADGPNLWIEASVQRPQAGKRITETLAWIDGPIAGPVGWFVFAYQDSDGYREIYGGPTIRPLPWLELGLGMGRENEGNRHRRSAHFSIDGEIGSFAGYFENGASGPAHKLYLNYWATHSLGIGLMEDFSGRGPRVVLRLGEKANLWGALLRDRADGATRGIAGLNCQF
ncbi:MAG: hypothetical protein HZB40_18350 [Rhodocyclales bacterium]|nr:hypothetical protein [Rhodocyclales bacterium]